MTTQTQTASVFERFRSRGESLPLKAESFDSFNRNIQAVITTAALADDTFQAAFLAQLKLDINKRIYNHQRSL